jgi:F0F1-type ATP synthase membrane subunit b/b'
MSFNAILTISEAEENAKKIKAEADAQAKERLAAAEKAGLAAVDAAVEKAAAELKELQSKADDKARDRGRRPVRHNGEQESIPARQSGGPH